MSESRTPDTGHEGKHVHLDRGRFDEGQATDEDLEIETHKPHGRFDDAERPDDAAVPGATRGRYDRGQATDEDVAIETHKPHGRYDDGERTVPPSSDEPQNDS